MKQLTKNSIKKGAEEVSEVLTKLFKVCPPSHLRKVILITFLVLFNVNVTTPGAMGEGQASMASVPVISKEQIYIRSVKSKMEDGLILEVEKYLNEIAPETKLSPELIVKECVKYNTDIIFVLAQGLLESHFGTKGKAATTNSVWNVGTYDDGQILYTYETPDESLEPYLKLINERYLINITSKGDTIYKDVAHLTSDRGYVNDDGKRFASARGYENAMRKLMISIDTKTSIKFYQEVLLLPDDRLLAYFNPEPEIMDPENYLALR